MPYLSTILAFLTRLIAVFAYVGPAYALHKIGKDLGIKHAWLAWVPFLNVYTLGAIADHQLKHNDGNNFPLRKLLFGLQLGSLGLPIVSTTVTFLLSALADLVIFPATVCTTLLSIFIPEIGGFMEAGASWESIVELLGKYLPTIFGIMLVFGLLNLVIKICLVAATLLFNLITVVLAWAVAIGKYAALYNVYRLYAPKYSLIFLAATLGLELLWEPACNLFYPTLLIIMAYRKPVYTSTEDKAAIPAEEIVTAEEPETSLDPLPTLPLAATV